MIQFCYYSTNKIISLFVVSAKLGDSKAALLWTLWTVCDCVVATSTTTAAATATTTAATTATATAAATATTTATAPTTTTITTTSGTSSGISALIMFWLQCCSNGGHVVVVAVVVVVGAITARVVPASQTVFHAWM